MRTPRPWGFRLALAAVPWVLLLWLRHSLPFPKKPPPNKPIPVRSVTSPLNQPAAGTAAACLESYGNDSAQCATYKNLGHVRFLGVPGLDRARTRALVSVVKMCGRYCGNGGIFEVEKAGATWRRADPTDFTRNCSWMY